MVTVILQVDVVRTRMMVQRRLQGGGEEGVRLYKSTIHCAYHTVSEFVLKREFIFFLTLQVQVKGGRLAWSASLQICRWCPWNMILHIFQEEVLQILTINVV